MRTRSAFAVIAGLAFSVLAVSAIGAAAGEYQNSPFLAQVGVTQANQTTSGGGAGVIIGIVDTGIDFTHSEFAGRFSKVGSACLVSGDCAGNPFGADDNGHGTHVAGIAAAGLNNFGMEGVAPRATLISIKVLDGFGSGSFFDVRDGILRARANGANAINLSLGPLIPAIAQSGSMLSAFRTAGTGSVIVLAAGNDGMNLSSGFFNTSSAGVLDRMLIVGSVDGANRISSFSNRPGSGCWLTNGVCASGDMWRNHFLVAPGERIASTYPGNLYAIMSGTSMATPVVTGAAALVMSRWPQLKSRPQDVASILLTTATDLGAPGIDPVYGAGLLNVTRALQPVGQVRVPTTSAPRGPSAPVAFSFLNFRRGFTRGLATDPILAKAIALDEFDRDFSAGLSNAVATPHTRLPLTEMLRGTRDYRPFAVTIGDNMSMFMMASGEGEWDRTIRFRPGEDKARLETFAMRVSLAPGLGLAAGAGYSLGANFGFAEESVAGPGGAFLTQTEIGLPHLELVDGGQNMAVTMAVDERTEIKLGFARNDAVSDSLGRTAANTAMLAMSRTAVAPWATVELSASYLDEGVGVLGSVGGGALQLGDGGKTRSAGIAVDASLGDGYLLRADYAEGRTAANAGGLFSALSDLRSRGYGLRLSRAGLFADDDMAGIAITQPLRVYDGHVTLTAATGFAGDDTLALQRDRLSLVPDGQEHDLEFAHAVPVMPGMDLRTNLIFRDDADNVAGSRELAALTKLRVRF